METRHVGVALAFLMLLFTVPAAFGANLTISDQTSCEDPSIGGTWDAGTSTCNVTGVPTPPISLLGSISTDASNSNQNWSLSHTVTSGTDVLVVGICTESAATITSANWNTSELMDNRQSDAYSGVVRSTILTLVDPTPGSFNIDFVMSEGKKSVTFAMNLDNVNTASLIDAVTGENSDVADPSIQITINKENSMIIDQLCREGGAPISETDTLIFSGSNGQDGISQRELTTTAGNYFQDYSANGKKKYSLSVIAINQVPSNLIVYSGDSLTIAPNVILENTDLIENFGTINLNESIIDNLSGATIDNSGAITVVTDSLGTIKNTGTINNLSGGTIDNLFDLLENLSGGIINNFGTIILKIIAGCCR